jgi:hypothetical protein
LAKRETPAAVTVTRHFYWPPTQRMEWQSIHSCADHQDRTVAEMRKLGPEEPQITPAGPIHGCKGCIEDWDP